MGNRIKRRAVAGAAILLGAMSAASGATAGTALADALGSGKPLIDLRARYEAVSDDNCAPCAGRDASARTLRARLGYETGVWHGFSALFAFDHIWSLGPQDYNSKSNGRTGYPVVADPTMTALDRLQLTYRSEIGTTITAGRQAIVLGDARFIGNVGFRQHEQTFDAVKLVNTSLPDTTLTYAWIGGVNRVFGPDVPSGAATGHYISDSYVLNAVYRGIPNLKLEAYAYLLDLKEARAASTATYGLHADWHVALTSALAAQFVGAFAHQTDYADNPNAVSLNYWTLEGQLHISGVTAGVGYEAMQGNGTVGFATPLATLHAFDGWADLFLATPKNGIDDLYAKLSVKAVDAFGIAMLTPLAGSQQLREKTNREGFVENSAFERLKEVVMSAMTIFDRLRRPHREAIRTALTGVKSPIAISIDTPVARLKAELTANKLERLLPLVDEIGREYEQLREIMLSSGNAGLQLSLIFHELERGVRGLFEAIRQREKIEDIEERSRYLKDLLEGFATVLKKEPARKHSLAKIAREAMFLNQLRFKKHRVAIDFPLGRGDQPDVMVRASLGLAIGGVSNAIDNAIFWTRVRWPDEQETGELQRKIWVGTSDEFGDTPALIVADNGPGFRDSPDDLIRPFWTRRPGGMGLGLYYANLAMELSGGKLLFPQPGDLDLPEWATGAVIAFVFKGA